MDQVVCKVTYKKNYEYGKSSNIENIVRVLVKNGFLIDISCRTILNTMRDNKKRLFRGWEISPVSGRERTEILISFMPETFPISWELNR